jgi:K+-transporting ATPase c subunit
MKKLLLSTLFTFAAAGLHAAISEAAAAAKVKRVERRSFFMEWGGSRGG